MVSEVTGSWWWMYRVQLRRTRHVGTRSSWIVRVTWDRISRVMGTRYGRWSVWRRCSWSPLLSGQRNGMLWMRRGTLWSPGFWSLHWCRVGHGWWYIDQRVTMMKMISIRSLVRSGRHQAIWDRSLGIPSWLVWRPIMSRHGLMSYRKRSILGDPYWWWVQYPTSSEGCTNPWNNTCYKRRVFHTKICSPWSSSIVRTSRPWL